MLQCAPVNNYTYSDAIFVSNQYWHRATRMIQRGCSISYFKLQKDEERILLIVTIFWWTMAIQSATEAGNNKLFGYV
jgi:hypothetical protein